MKLNEMDLDLSITSTIPTAWNRNVCIPDGRRDSFGMAPLRVAELGLLPADLMSNSRHGVTRSIPCPAPSALAGWVRQEVERLNWSSDCVERAQPMLGPKASLILEMLALDAVKGVLPHGAAAKKDPKRLVINEMSEGLIPTAEESEQFRELHPGLIETVVAAVMVRAIR